MKKILKSLPQILKGLFYFIFKNNKVERVAAKRIKICKSCDTYSEHSGCLVSGTEPCCSIRLGGCGCSLKLKTRSLSSDCPKGKWLAVMSEAEESILKSKLGYNE